MRVGDSQEEQEEAVWVVYRQRGVEWDVWREAVC